MKSKKYFYSSIIMLFFSLLSLVYFEGSYITRCIRRANDQGIGEPLAYYFFFIFAIIGIVFFILGWTVKDRAAAPIKDNPTEPKGANFMKSVKYMITSVVCLIFSIFFLYWFTSKNNPAPGIILFCIFLIAFLVFFILGWVIKDKPEKPEKHILESDNDKETK